jgi:hypothetical protein
VHGGRELVQISWLIVSSTMNPLIDVPSVIAAGLAVGLVSIGPGVGQGYSRLGRFSSTISTTY